MLWTALQDPDPVLIFENVMLYNRTGQIDTNAGPVEITRASIRRTGKDLSLITYGGSLFKTLEAAEELARDGIEAEVIDLRSLRPLDDATIMASVAKTRRAVIVDEGWRSGSLAAEISARIMEQVFWTLDAPVGRVCSEEVPIPYPKHLEDAAIPQVPKIVAAAKAAAREELMGVFTLPSLGADMEAGKLVEWLVGPGDTVKRGDIVAVLETQKGAIEIECFEEGTVTTLMAKVGQDLPVGTPLAVILAPGEAPPGISAASGSVQGPAPAAADRVPDPAAATSEARLASAIIPPANVVPASPAARLRARELGLDLATLTGSFPGGGIILTDVEAADGRTSSTKPAPPPSPMEEMRKAIAAAMTRAKQTIPHFYLSQTINVQPAMDWLADCNEGKPPAERLLLGALFVRAAVLAATKVKGMNGRYVDGAFHPSGRVNAGIAVALRGGGLVAPALIDAERMTIETTMAGMRDLVTRARAGRLRSSEMTEGTITISSLGETGAEAMTGVIFPPQVALVGLGAPQLRPWVVDGAVVPRNVVTLTMSADHRVSDGRQVAKFIAEFETLIAALEKL